MSLNRSCLFQQLEPITNISTGQKLLKALIVPKLGKQCFSPPIPLVEWVQLSPLVHYSGTPSYDQPLTVWFFLEKPDGKKVCVLAEWENNCLYRLLISEEEGLAIREEYSIHNGVPISMERTITRLPQSSEPSVEVFYEPDSIGYHISALRHDVLWQYFEIERGREVKRRETILPIPTSIEIKELSLNDLRQRLLEELTPCQGVEQRR